ncbi:uncharacterized protein [Diadema antillarum]|uniref:uncharacterized protein n=1 Tax=Diadema antillarum TaxID=105358 RepID=UPI003A87EA7A
MKATMQQGSTIRAEIQAMLDVGRGQHGQSSPRSREKSSFGQYLYSVLPTIHDSLWLDCRFEINKVLDKYQRKSRDLERVQATIPQHTARTQQSTSLGQQVVAHQLQQTFEKSCTPSPMRMGLAQWQYEYQRPEQTYLFPEGQTTFTPQQMALFDQPRATAPAALGVPPVHTRMVRVVKPPLVQTIIGPSAAATSTITTPATFVIPQVPTSSPEVSRCHSASTTFTGSEDFLAFNSALGSGSGHIAAGRRCASQKSK